jgi:hypothetical protein
MPHLPPPSKPGPLRSIAKARPGDYPAYAEMYMRLLPEDGRILEHLRDNFLTVRTLIYGLPAPRLLHRYAPDKWSIKDILVHLIDDERIYAYRALCFARGEPQGLVGFDQDAYAGSAGADARSLDGIFEEYEAVRRSTIALYNNLPEASLDRRGHGTGSFEGATVRALVYHIAGHELHHLGVIRERYL